MVEYSPSKGKAPGLILSTMKKRGKGGRENAGGGLVVLSTESREDEGLITDQKKDRNHNAKCEPDAHNTSQFQLFNGQGDSVGTVAVTVEVTTLKDSR